MRGRTCKLCKVNFHACSSCGLSGEEYEASYLGICFNCWKSSGAQQIYRVYEDQKDALDVLRDEEINRLIESKYESNQS